MIRVMSFFYFIFCLLFHRLNCPKRRRQVNPSKRIKNLDGYLSKKIDLKSNKANKIVQNKF